MGKEDAKKKTKIPDTKDKRKEVRKKSAAYYEAERENAKDHAEHMIFELSSLQKLIVGIHLPSLLPEEDKEEVVDRIIWTRNAIDAFAKFMKMNVAVNKDKCKYHGERYIVETHNLLRDIAEVEQDMLIIISVMYKSVDNYRKSDAYDKAKRDLRALTRRLYIYCKLAGINPDIAKRSKESKKEKEAKNKGKNKKKEK